MNEQVRKKTWEFIALTDIWTGDIDGKRDRLITTGLLGSIRWWFEVVVRGLGGYACDPSAKRKTCQDDKHCVVCELFGCTGWTRKFRFDVLNENDRPRTKQIEKGDTFRLRFTPLHPICDEEWALLDLTLRLIADYGAIGGKAVYKPTDQEQRKNKVHHQDHGLVTIHLRPDVPFVERAGVERHVTRDAWRCWDNEGYAWASLENFWFVDRTLARTSGNSSPFNRVVGREEPKNQSQQVRKDRASQWLAGSTGNSKKVFSFSLQPRSFGFVNPGVVSHKQMKAKLKTAWADLANDDYQTGNGILDRLLASPEASS